MNAQTEIILRNSIINSLPSDSRQKFKARLEPVEMPLGQFIFQPHEPIKHIYFPETSVISVVTYLENGNCVETGIIGCEGLSGAEAALAGKVSLREAMVQLSGFGNRMPTADFQEFFYTDRNFAELVMNSVYAFIGQISQNSVCLNFHSVEKRLARWLLMFHDRAAGDELKLTQEFIAIMLGVHRPVVSKYANKLQTLGFINYNRGKIKILDRAGLVTVSCECYETNREIFVDARL